MRTRVPRARLLRPMLLQVAEYWMRSGPACGGQRGESHMDIPPLTTAVVPVMKVLSSLA